MTGEYDPLRSPFEMPLTMFGANCLLARPLVLEERPGASPATLLRGALGAALVQAGLGWLHEPRSHAQRRSHPSPIVMRVHVERETPQDIAPIIGIELAIALLGRKACERTPEVVAALRATGETGLTQTQTSFAVQMSSPWTGTLGGWIHERSVGLGPDVTVDLVTPMDRASPELPGMLADTAHELVQWDLVDSGLADLIGKQGCDPLAEQAREHVAGLLSGVHSESNVAHTHRGRRRSHSNGGHFALQGYMGQIKLAAVPSEALPWLIALELRGGGRKTSLGLGDVRLRTGNVSERRFGRVYP